MKSKLFIAILFYSFNAFSQRQPNFFAVDHHAASIAFDSPDSLAKKLTRPFNSEIEKIRAIFKWMTENIAYNTASLRNRRGLGFTWEEDIHDSLAEMPSLNFRVANMVLHRKTAVCDGYARLFKTLCDFAGIRSEIVRGYARSGWNRNSGFTSNHIWNAVYIDGNWQLLDVTWAAGYITFSNEFVKSYDESYFLAPPEVFIWDHIPEDVGWCLLYALPVIKEFQTSPFKYAATHQFKINSYQPAKGIIEAYMGDTLQFILDTAPGEKLLRISNSNYVDSNLFYNDEDWKYPRPAGLVNGRIIAQTYVVNSYADDWLYVILNEEVILRYRLVVRLKN